MNVLIDLSNSHEGRELELLDVLIARRPEILSAQRGIVVSADSDDIATAPTKAYSIRSTTGPCSTQELTNDIRNLMSHEDSDESGPFSPVTVWTFNQEIEDHATRDLGDRLQLEFRDLRNVLREKARDEPLPPQKVTEWPSHLIELDDVISLLQEVLTQAGGELKMTQIRPALATRDSRLQKRPSTARELRAPGLIKLLVNAAQSSGAIDVYSENDPVNPTIRLKESRLTTGASKVSSDSLARQVEQDDERPSSRFINILREERLGPFQEVRLAAYDALEKAFNEDPGITVSSLLDRSVAAVRRDVESAKDEGRSHLIKNKSGRMAWGRLRSFLALLVTRRPILLGPADTPLTASWHDLESNVVLLSSGWREKLDSELILAILKTEGQLDVYDEEDLAGALYNSRSEIRMVQACIRSLIDEGLCTVDEHLTIRPNPTNFQDT